MAERLKGKVALVSGGATGMGEAAAKRIAAEGAKVAIVDRNIAAGEATAAAIRAAGGDAIFIEADVAEEASVGHAVNSALTAFGPVTALFNHAGSIVIKPFLETTFQEWEWLMAVNVRSMFLMTKAVLPSMIGAGGGAIVCTSSISAVAATPNEVLYDTTKAACQMFARAIAVEFREKGVRCNAVCPGFIDTPHGKREVEGLTRYGVDVSDAAIRMQQGRMGRPEDIAGAVVFLLSDESQFITGTQLVVDNGFTAV
jgi:NAD(P)-dependent dehydrogenase (short-subunit alcohol dehydrogenase family)